jgi:hypothetical protein
VAIPETRVFISFKHNRWMTWVASTAKLGLEQRFIQVYRLIDDPRTGALFSQQIREGIAWSHGVLVLWSPMGAASPWVQYEYNTARELGRPIALVRTNDAPPNPPDWIEDERTEELAMVAWPRGLFARSMNPSVPAWKRGEWNALLDRLADWSRAARDRRLPPRPT